MHLATWFTTNPEALVRSTPKPKRPKVVVVRRDGKIIRRVCTGSV
jgi:hypothetical protein